MLIDNVLYKQGNLFPLLQCLDDEKVKYVLMETTLLADSWVTRR